MAENVRFFVNDTSTLRREANPGAQLKASLRRIVTECPPRSPWTDTFKDKGVGLWTGPTSLAYLFLWLSKTHPNLEIEGKFPYDWCLAYLNCGSGDLPNGQGLNGWGVKNEYLAYHTVKAAATQDLSSVTKLVNALDGSDGVSFDCPDVDNEHLSGRAGTLALLRIVRHFVKDPTATEQTTLAMKPLIQHILQQVPWRFHKHNYIGAAHGVIGILTQLILSDHSLGTNPIVVQQLSEQLDLQTPDGHWFITDDPNLGENNLVHYCHGSPGFSMSFQKIRPFVSPELQARIDTAVERGNQEVWEKGLLRKEPNLCHGITGNMLALTDWAQREHFMAFTTMEEIQQGKTNGRFITGDDPHGLFWGEAGRAWGWMMMDLHEDLGYPSYTDV